MTGLGDGSPAKVGLGIALGVTIGLTPLYGLHLLLSVLVAMALRLNVAVVYAAANVSLPPLVPLIAIACVQTGHFVVHGQLLPMQTLHEDSWQTLLKTGALYWMLGAVMLGPLGGGTAGWIVYRTLKRRQARASGDATATTVLPAAAIERLYQAFLPAGRMVAETLRGKLRYDAVYGEVLVAARDAARLVDVGGGCGALHFLLAAERQEQGLAEGELTVVDWDEEKLAAGRCAAARLGVSVEFTAADVFSAPLPIAEPADSITCLDLLHYAPLTVQRRLVAQLAGRLRPGGRLIIRDMDADLRWRTFCTVVQERGSLLMHLTRASRIVPRSGQDLVRQLESLGFHVIARRCHGKLPFSNTLWVATLAAGDR